MAHDGDTGFRPSDGLVRMTFTHLNEGVSAGERERMHPAAHERHRDVWDRRFPQALGRRAAASGEADGPLFDGVGACPVLTAEVCDALFVSSTIETEFGARLAREVSAHLSSGGVIAGDWGRLALDGSRVTIEGPAHSPAP